MDEAKQKLIRQGGTLEATYKPGETYADWLAFLTNPLNLEPGMPDLTIYMDHNWDQSVMTFSFDEQRASLSSIKMDLGVYFDVESIIEEQDETKEINMLLESETSRPPTLRRWLFNLSLHPGLTELEILSDHPELRNLFELVEKRNQC